MSSNKRRFMRSLFKANGGCGCSKPKSYDVHQPSPKLKIPIYQNTNPTTVSSSTTSIDNDDHEDDQLFTSTTTTTTTTTTSTSEHHTNHQNPNNNMPKPDSKLVDTVAVEKESNDPHKDFRDSMLQMIFERKIYTKTDLQELLECFLQLNAACHHQVIVQAFVEICRETFPKKNINHDDGHD